LEEKKERGISRKTVRKKREVAKIYLHRLEEKKRSSRKREGREGKRRNKDEEIEVGKREQGMP